jgi:peptidyl-prolyl cis-trans isomerase B (cyclophilin B)
MNQSIPGASPGAPAQPVPHHVSIWDRLLDDLHKRPRRYINGVIMLAVPVLIVVLGIQFWRTHRAGEAGNLATRWLDALASDKPAKERVSMLEELGPELTTDSQRALRLYDLATTYKELADSATTQDEKLAGYEKSLAAATELKSKYPNALWSKMPMRPPTSGSSPTPPMIDQLAETARSQIAWLKQHPYTGVVEPDPGLKVTVELEDGRKFTIGKFFSKAAPFHVQNFVELARRGYFDGTAFSKIAQGYKKGAQPKQGDRPPGISIEGGHPMTKVTPDNREDDDNQAEIGYSVKEEANPLSPTRGAVAAVGDPQSGGDSPSRFKIFGDEPNYGMDTIFAEVTEGLDVVDALINSPTAEGKPSRPRDLVRIKKMTVEGSVLSPPERPFPPEPKLPEAPKPESRPESQPDSRGVETQSSQPASRDQQPPK